MAAVGEAPTLFLRKATGLVKGWSKFDAFLYSFMSVNFVTLGLFFALSVLAFVPTGQVLPALLISGVFVTFLVITYAGPDLGDAAGRRRLRLAEPGARRRHRVRPGGHRLVVHPVVLGADLREHPERRGVPAARRDLQVGRPADVPGDRTTACSSCASSRSLLAGYLRLARDGGLREGPAGLLLHRDGRRSPSIVRRDAVRLAERLPERVQPARRRTCSGHGRTSYAADDRSSPRRTTAAPIVPSLGFSPFFGDTPAADPVPVLLDPVAELGRHAVRRGPRRERLQARDGRDDVRPVGHDRHRGACSSCWRRSSSAGSSSTRRT